MSWLRGFARQAESDFQAWEHLLKNTQLPPCHQLHFLQMAMEKAAKAHLIAGGSDPHALQKSHAYIAKVVPIIVQRDLGRSESGGAPAWVLEAVRSLARRVELLHPQVSDGDAVQANCEYPWEDGQGRVCVPAEHNFQLNLHTEKAAVTMIKAVRARAAELAKL